MSAMLASGAYPKTVIRVEDCDTYLAALESASFHMDIRPFARFVAERVEWSLERGDVGMATFGLSDSMPLARV